MKKETEKINITRIFKIIVTVTIVIIILLASYKYIAYQKKLNKQYLEINQKIGDINKKRIIFTADDRETYEELRKDNKNAWINMDYDELLVIEEKTDEFAEAVDNNIKVKLEKAAIGIIVQNVKGIDKIKNLKIR